MMLCLCCGKEIRETASSQEKASLWHEKCSKQFFGTKAVPSIDITEAVLSAIAIESTSRGFTVPGVQKKLSLHLTSGKRGRDPRLTLVDYPTGYILKPQTKEYESLPEAEHLVMTMARTIGIRTVPFALIRQGDEYAYITKRIDRSIDRSNHLEKMLAMEDFCQLDGRMTADKYRGSYERCGKIIARYSSRPGLDMTEFFVRIVFSYLVGNSDMHLKNFSLIETEENSRNYVLADAYDLLPMNLLLPEDEEQVALSLNGKKRDITRNDLLKLAENCQIDRKVADKLIDRIISRKDRMIALCRESYLSDVLKRQFEEFIIQRAAAISRTSGEMKK